MIDIDVITLHDGDYYIIDSAIKDNIKYLLLSKTCDEKLKKAEEAITKLVKDNNEVVDFQVEE